MRRTRGISLPSIPISVRAASAARGAPGVAAFAPGVPEPDAPASAVLEQFQRERDDERAALNHALAALHSGLEQISTLREEILKDAEAQLVELAVDIARKVLMQEIQAGRYAIDPIVQAALRQVPPRQDVTAHLHPEDWARCQMVRESSSNPAAGYIRFVADPGVPRAECLLETPEGIVQSAVDEHLERITDALRHVE